MDTNAAAFDPPKTSQTQGSRSWQGSSTLAESLLSAARPLQPCRGSPAVLPVREIGPLTGEPDAGNPPVRFGGRGGVILRPYPNRNLPLTAVPLGIRGGFLGASS